MKPEEPVDENSGSSRIVAGLIWAGIGLGVSFGIPAYQAWNSGRAFGDSLCHHYQPGLTMEQTFRRLWLTIQNDKSIKEKFNYDERFEELGFKGFDSALAKCDLEFDIRKAFAEANY